MKTIIATAEKENIETAGKILRSGGIVAFPTDTVYGLGAVCTDENAIQKLFDAKGRDEGKPISILVDGFSRAEEIAAGIPDSARRLMQAFWPGAITIILKKRPEISDKLSAGGDTIGLRMPASEVAVRVIKSAGSPLAAPSANTSGKRSAVTAEDVREDLDGKIDMILDGGACPVGVSSTVVDLTGKEPVILREGSITKSMIDEVLSLK